MKIAVVGASGLIGSMICTELEKRGHQVVPLSRATGADATRVETLIPAFTGADVVVDATNHAMTFSAKKSEENFTPTATNIAQAAQENDVKRIVCVSIVGVNDPKVSRGYGYYAGKAAQEKVYRESAVDSVILESTQWFELVEPLVQMGSLGPVAVLPTMRIAPIPAQAAAQFTCDVIEGNVDIPESGTVSIRGAEQGTVAQFAKRILAARGEIAGKNLKAVWQLPYFGSAIAQGKLIPDPADRTESTTLEEWLAKQ